MLRAVILFLTGLVLVLDGSGCGQQSTATRPSTPGNAQAESDDGPKRPVTVVSDPPEQRAVAANAPADREASIEASRAQQIHRPDDLREARDGEKLAEAGIRIFKSKRLKLYTDIDESIAKTLPPLIDQLYDSLEDYFGPMPPDRAGRDFQMSGYLMRDMALFREMRLLPEELMIEHGRHRRNEFWMRDQGYDYYRRHLLIHEATHCFMTFMPDVNVPLWYLEGMAELFGCHRLDDHAKATFRVMQTSEPEFAGFARIRTIREDVAAGKFQTIPSLFSFKPAEFVTIRHYAWSWGLCAFLDGTPRYHERFQSLGGHMHGSQFSRMFNELFDSDMRDLSTEWVLFTANLQYGYDTKRAEIDFREGTPLDTNRTVEIKADRGWQSSGVRVEAGQKYSLNASGQFTLANTPKPWISEPQGISFRYFDEHPLGKVMGGLRVDQQQTTSTESMLDSFVIGRGIEYQPNTSGTLYFRINDAWNSLNDNRGNVQVTIGKEAEKP